MYEMYPVGAKVEIEVSGYDFGYKNQWIEAVVSRPPTVARIWVMFRMRSGREIERLKPRHKVRPIIEDPACP